MSANFKQWFGNGITENGIPKVFEFRPNITEYDDLRDLCEAALSYPVYINEKSEIESVDKFQEINAVRTSSLVQPNTAKIEAKLAAMTGKDKPQSLAPVVDKSKSNFTGVTR